MQHLEAAAYGTTWLDGPLGGGSVFKISTPFRLTLPPCRNRFSNGGDGARTLVRSNVPRGKMPANASRIGVRKLLRTKVRAPFRPSLTGVIVGMRSVTAGQDHAITFNHTHSPGGFPLTQLGSFALFIPHNMSRFFENVAAKFLFRFATFLSTL